jgi:ribosomal protein L37AE/L43A
MKQKLSKIKALQELIYVCPVCKEVLEVKPNPNYVFICKSCGEQGNYRHLQLITLYDYIVSLMETKETNTNKVKGIYHEGELILSFDKNGTPCLNTDYIEETLINFLLTLNDKGLINNHDFDYEAEANEFLENSAQEVEKHEEPIFCHNCKHWDNDFWEEPCNSCLDFGRIKWEAAD